MKKATVILLCLGILVGVLSGCQSYGFVNVLLLTDNLNKIYKEERIDISDYFLTDGVYRLYIEDGKSRLLFSLEADEEQRIEKVRLTLSKADEKGKLINPTENETEFFRKNVTDILEAYTLCSREKAEELTKKILPLKSADFSTTGELNFNSDEFVLIYYSNKISCQFTVINTFLQEVPTTEKPVSKPLYSSE